MASTGRVAITRSGGMPCHSAAAGRMKCTPLPEQIQTENPRAVSSAMSSFIGWKVVSDSAASKTG